MKQTIQISNSEIQTLKDCPRKWWLTYYRELAPNEAETVGPLALGTKIHLVLDAVYTKPDVEPLALLRELYDADEVRLQDHPFKDDEIKKLDKEFDLAHAMVEGFLQWREEEGIDDGYKLFSVEEVLTAKVLDTGDFEVWLRGKLDQRLIRESDGMVIFNDWKTTQTFKDKWMLQMNEQMKTYHLLEFLNGEKMTDGAFYTMLRKVKRTAAAKPPFYHREPVRHNAQEIANFYKNVQEQAARIVGLRRRLDAGEDHQSVVPPRPSRDCSWKCKEFAKICPMFDDGSRVEDAVKDMYRHQDPHERYKKEEEVESNGGD